MSSVSLRRSKSKVRVSDRFLRSVFSRTSDWLLARRQSHTLDCFPSSRYQPDGPSPSRSFLTTLLPLRPSVPSVSVRMRARSARGLYPSLADETALASARGKILKRGFAQRNLAKFQLAGESVSADAERRKNARGKNRLRSLSRFPLLCPRSSR